VLPPAIAPNKAAIVPIMFEDSKKEVLAACRKLKQELAEYNPLLDERDEYTPGWKFNEWELKGVPVRIELGPKDLKAGQAVLVRRDNGERKTAGLCEVGKKIKEMLESMQKDLLAKSKKMTENAIVEVKTMDELVEAIKKRKIAKGQFCNIPECEDCIKEKTDGAGTRGITKGLKPTGKCIHCGKPAKVIVNFGKSY
jgi:prolyl-tRNA synthetase